MEVKDGIYKKEKYRPIRELSLNSNDCHTRVINKFDIDNTVFIIKSINGYIFKYALAVLNGRKYDVIANSDSVNFLQTFAITKYAIE